MLIDRGLVELTAPVATYWPEFAGNGKQDIEFRHVLSHTSGVSGWKLPFTTEDMYDWDKSTAALAAQAPWWQPGTASGYHAHNQGHLIGEVMRRVTGRSLKEFVCDEIAGPLRADFQLGAKRADYDRIAEIIAPLPSNCHGPAPRRQPDAQNLQWPAAQRRRRKHACVARGRPGRAQRPRKRPLPGDDTVGGYGLAKNEALPYVPDEQICFWGGWGGSMVLMWPERRTTIAMR
jgi:CubicO group peptidase (beta-lactamase class C family)